MQKLSIAYQAERCRNLDRWGLNGAMGWAIWMVWFFWHQRLDVHPPTLSHWVHNLKSRSAHKLGTSPPKWGLHMARSADQNINFPQDWCVTATDRATGWLRLGSYFVASAQSSKTDAACISLHVSMKMTDFLIGIGSTSYPISFILLWTQHGTCNKMEPETWGSKDEHTNGLGHCYVSSLVCEFSSSTKHTNTIYNIYIIYMILNVG